MANGTRGQEFKKLDESVRLLKEGFEGHTFEMGEIKTSLKTHSTEMGEIKLSLQALGDFKEMFTAITMKYDQMAAHVYGKQHQESFRISKNQLEVATSSHSVLAFGTKYAKIDFLKFFGDDPTGWIYKCERFFEYNSIDNGNKVKLAILHLEDRALQWYQWFEKTHCIVNWGTFKQGILARFGPDEYEDAVGALTKLRQHSTVKEYQEQFEILANKTLNLPKSFFTSCFVSGLKEEIRANVLMFRPTTTTQAISLAKLQEYSIAAITKKAKQGVQMGETNSSNKFKTSSYPNPVRRELPKELEERKAKGLCFTCNEKYTRGHQCKKRQLYALDGEEKDQVQEQLQENEEEDPEIQEPNGELQISINALTGSVSYRTMRIQGNVKKKLIIILIDSGSTHNFLNLDVVKRVGVNITETDPLPVSIADGTKLISTAVCLGFKWEMQGTIFQADMRVL